MEARGPRPSSYTTEREGLALSGPALRELVRAVLSRGARFRFRAGGCSMWPFVRDGDVVTVAPLDGARPGRGRVVAFVHPHGERLVVHRVVGKKDGRLLIKGDNAHVADGLVGAASVLGWVTRVERQGRDAHLGLGPERLLVALLSRWGWLRPVLSIARRLVCAVRGNRVPAAEAPNVEDRCHE